MIISGGMCGGANDIFTEKGIGVIVGADRPAKIFVELYLKGKFQSNGFCMSESIVIMILVAQVKSYNP